MGQSLKARYKFITRTPRGASVGRQDQQGTTDDMAHIHNRRRLDSILIGQNPNDKETTRLKAEVLREAVAGDLILWPLNSSSQPPDNESIKTIKIPNIAINRYRASTQYDNNETGLRAMEKQSPSRLYDQNDSIEFYESRYTNGYMDEWPEAKKKKIFEVIRDLHLPEKGNALDFGCGNGVLTEVIRQALPSWNIYGTDISITAIQNAQKRYPECFFPEIHDSKLKLMKFDFVFTNHVFEHVFNLTEVFNEMLSYLKPNSSMLHFLPCGNEGSYEYNVCLLRTDGINPAFGNRFFFEDEGHIRRLNSKEFQDLSIENGFKLIKEHYSNQHYGAIDWITLSGKKFILMFTDSSMSIDSDASKKLKKIRAYLITINIFRNITNRYDRALKYKKKSFIILIKLIFMFPIYIFSKQVDKYYRMKANEEWKTQKHNHNGSEMALYFKRG